jgi:hypothetical protein
VSVWKEVKDRTHAKDSHFKSGREARYPQANYKRASHTSRHRPPSIFVSVFGFYIYCTFLLLNVFGYSYPVFAGVDLKGSETQVAQTCVIALRL